VNELTTKELEEHHGQEQAALLAIQQGLNWMQANGYGDVLTGNQLRALAVGLYSMMLPPMKFAITAEIGDGLSEKFPEIGAAIGAIYQSGLEELHRAG
jgi:NAD(P)H-hydrate repair Nnr-like enzyme with NAD(P)H-hydrate dehydratase domain